MNIKHVYALLYNRYNELNWWPADSPFEVMVGAVLTQNTNWNNVEKAIANFGDKLSPELIEHIDIADLREIIRPAGFFNQKANYLKAITSWFKVYNYDVNDVKSRSSTLLRAELLAVKGVGRETADSILLYAFDFPEFVVDAYTIRLLERFGEPARNYEGVKALFQAELPRDTLLYNNYHACIVINGKEHCRKNPVCAGCPLEEICLKSHIAR